MQRHPEIDKVTSKEVKALTEHGPHTGKIYDTVPEGSKRQKTQVISINKFTTAMCYNNTIEISAVQKFFNPTYLVISIN